MFFGFFKVYDVDIKKGYFLSLKIAGLSWSALRLAIIFLDILFETVTAN